MDHTMDKMPTEGWVAIVAAALGAKPLWDYLTRKKTLDAAQERDRAEHSAEIELRKLTADEGKDHKLIRLLEKQVKELERRVDELTKAQALMGDERTQDKVIIATQAATITRLEMDNARLRDRLRRLGEEVSEADDAPSGAGKVGP